jgi:hypothetical protein
VAVWWYLAGLGEGDTGLDPDWYAAAIMVHILATATMPEGLEALNSEIDRLVRGTRWLPADS